MGTEGASPSDAVGAGRTVDDEAGEAVLAEGHFDAHAASKFDVVLLRWRQVVKQGA